MPFLVAHPRIRAAALLGLQGAVWVVLTLAFAALIQAAGWASWGDAFHFSAINWLPWVALAPAIFWLARKFPFERGHFLRSIPVHLVAGSACMLAAIWASAYFAPRRPPVNRPPPPGETRPGETRPGGPTGLGGSRENLPRPVGELGPERRIGEGSVIAPVLAAGETPEGAGAVPTLGGTGNVEGERRAGRGGPRRNWEGGDRREFGGGPPAFRGPPRPPEGAAGTLRRWAWLGSFWPPFGSMMLRANFTAALYLIIACLAHAVGYYRRAQERETQALALTAGLNRAKLDALRLQLQPHFLFNTLNAISALVHRNPHAADELIADLSELLRLSLQSAEHEVPLSRELELLQSYLSIEQTRLGDRLRVIRQIDPAALSAFVPTLVLQPLAENAVRHGIEPRLSPGTLTISARVDGDLIRLEVADDGVGLKNAPPKTARGGIGLTNTEQRLQALHGNAARLAVHSPESGGVRIEITLPRRTTPTPAAAPKPVASAA